MSIHFIHTLLIFLRLLLFANATLSSQMLRYASVGRPSSTWIVSRLLCVRIRVHFVPGLLVLLVLRSPMSVGLNRF